MQSQPTAMGHPRLLPIKRHRSRRACSALCLRCAANRLLRNLRLLKPNPADALAAY
jgi:hypothetical protein